MRSFGRYVFVPGDWAAALLSWLFFSLFRKTILEGMEYVSVFADTKFRVSLIVLPFFWIFLHWISGSYTDPYRKSRLQEFFRTLMVTLIGSTILFFSLLLDDLVKSYKDYYISFIVLFSTQFALTYSFRFILFNYIKHQFKKGTFRFPTLLIGCSSQADEVIRELESDRDIHLYDIRGFIQTGEQIFPRFQSGFRQFGGVDAIEQCIQREGIEELIIATEPEEREMVNRILNQVADRNLYVKIVPDTFDILSGSVRLNHIIDEAFVEIPPQMLSEWEKNIKRVTDICGALIALIIFSPIMIFVAIRIKLDSPGPVFYEQERLGQFRKPFRMKKFRSMKTDAENGTPRLTQDDDDRITRTGRWIRKYRFDELPQFFHVLSGEMSLVGPRAERAYFAKQIQERVPYYNHIFRVKPGITSLGMVKYGYASNIDEMVRRLKYDILYIENMGWLTDLKVLLYTVITVIRGKGK